MHSSRKQSRHTQYLLLGRDMQFVVTQYLDNVFLLHRQELLGPSNVDKELLNVLVARLNEAGTHELITECTNPNYIVWMQPEIIVRFTELHRQTCINEDPS